MAPGWVAISYSEKGLRRLILPQNSFTEACRQLGIDSENTTEIPPVLSDVVNRLKYYFAGEKVSFPDTLDLTGATGFRRQVWEITQSIPYGETRSYSWVAGRLGKPQAVRAVGQALGRNPLPVIIPCHRVIRRDGSLGGYTSGLAMKRYLLGIESPPSL